MLEGKQVEYREIGRKWNRKTWEVKVRSGEGLFEIGEVSSNAVDGKCCGVRLLDKLVMDGELGRKDIEEFMDYVGVIRDAKELKEWHRRCREIHCRLVNVFGEDYNKKWNGDVEDETRIELLC